MDDLLLEKTIKQIEQIAPAQLNESYGVYEEVFRKLPSIGCSPLDFSLDFFRVRDVDSNVNEHLPSSFSYKPQSLNPKLNRLNLQGESVFYGAIYPYTAIKECGIKQEQEFYLSKWFIPEEAHLTMYRLFSEPELVTNEKAAKLLQYVNSRGYNDSTRLLSILAEKLTSEQDGMAKYNFTALYASFMRRNRFHELEDEDGNKVHFKADGFLYKSVKSNNPNEINLAIFPDVIDKWASLDFVIKGTINESYDKMLGVIGILNEDKIVWNNTIKPYNLINPE